MIAQTHNGPDRIIVEFLQANGDAVPLADLGPEFIAANGIAPSKAALPFRVQVERQIGQAGSAFYEYAQNGVPLPDGLATLMRVAGTIVPMGPTKRRQDVLARLPEPGPSESGYPTKEGEAQAVKVGGVAYTATVYLVESATPFYIKIIAHEALPERGEITARRAPLTPRGGRIIT
jgi:hypothetical protein